MLRNQELWIRMLFVRFVIVVWTVATIELVLATPQSAGDLDEVANQAATAQKHGDYRRARELYSELASRRPDVPEIRANIGFMDHLLGDYAGAITNFRQAISQKPSLTNAVVVLGTDLVKLRRPKEAVGYLDSLCIPGRLISQACMVLGEAHVMLGNYLEAADCYQRVLSSEPSNSEARYDLGIVYFSMYRFAVERVAQHSRSPYLHQLTDASVS